MESNSRPMLARISPRSLDALLSWAIRYAIAHPQEISSEGLERLSRGTYGERVAAATLRAAALGPAFIGRPNIY
jgi:hypothetical protein